MPWLGRLEYDKLMNELAELRVKYSFEQTRSDKLELEKERYRQDFNELVLITAGRVPPRMSSMGLDRDPFAEREDLPETYLTPDPDESGINIEQALKAMSETPADGGSEGR
jgi:hypothetical protein